MQGKQLSRWPYDLFPRNAAAQSSSHDHQINNNEITEAARSESEYLDPSEELPPNFIHKPQSFVPSRIPKPVQDLYAAFSCFVGVLFVGYMVYSLVQKAIKDTQKKNLEDQSREVDLLMNFNGVCNMVQHAMRSRRTKMSLMHHN
ncbi:hypothetical protein P8452_11132 [Trifolium repens]|nr:hypothetical protein P8452_11132 [Trifolium repens]